MTVRKILGTIVATTALTAFITTTAMAGVAGNYKRPNGKTAKVSVCGGGGLRASSGGTLMFACARKAGKGVWKSSNMKHPEFPGTFKGTIRQKGSTLNVQGCFGFICPSENWKK